MIPTPFPSLSFFPSISPSFPLSVCLLSLFLLVVKISFYYGGIVLHVQWNGFVRTEDSKFSVDVLTPSSLVTEKGLLSLPLTNCRVI